MDGETMAYAKADNNYLKLSANNYGAKAPLFWLFAALCSALKIDWTLIPTVMDFVMSNHEYFF